MAKQRAEELVGRMSQLVEPAEDWHEIGAQDEPVFDNSWVNYDSSTYSTAAFYKHGNNVYIKGLVKSGTVGSVPVFTLPSGYRPALTHHFAIASNNAFGTARVLASGEVQVTVGSNVWASLDGISFRVG